MGRGRKISAIWEGISLNATAGGNCENKNISIVQNIFSGCEIRIKTHDKI